MAKKPELKVEVTPELEEQIDRLGKAFGSQSQMQAIRSLVRKLKVIRDTFDTGSYELHVDVKPSNVLVDTGVFFDTFNARHLTPEDLLVSTFGPIEKARESQHIEKKPKPISTLVVSALIIPEAKVADGLSIQTITISWQEIVKHLEKNWDVAHKIPPEKWEEIIAGAFKKEGYDEVVLTPRSGDEGRDVIAIRKGIGTVKILGSVKAYGPGQLVRHTDVRDLVGVLAMEPDSSKGIITTTSDFAPKIYTNPRYKALMPTRLELVNGKQLQQWLVELSKKS